MLLLILQFLEGRDFFFVRLLVKAYHLLHKSRLSNNSSNEQTLARYKRITCLGRHMTAANRIP
jgi:hypothetical protein